MGAVAGDPPTYRRSGIDVGGDVVLVATDTTTVITNAVAASVAVAIGVGSVALGEVYNINTVANVVNARIIRSDVDASSVDSAARIKRFMVVSYVVSGFVPAAFR